MSKDYHLLSERCEDCKEATDRDGMRLVLLPEHHDHNTLDGPAVACFGCLTIKREATGADIAVVQQRKGTAARNIG